MSIIKYLGEAKQIRFPYDIAAKLSGPMLSSKICYLYNNKIYLGYKACGTMLENGRRCCEPLSIFSSCKTHEDVVDFRESLCDINGIVSACIIRHSPTYVIQYGLFDIQYLVIMKEICSTCTAYTPTGMCCCSVVPKPKFRPLPKWSDPNKLKAFKKRFKKFADEQLPLKKRTIKE